VNQGAKGIIRVVAVDDHRCFVDAIELLLEHATRDIRVVATATSGSVAIQRVREFRPDVVLMDVMMPGVSGLEAARELRMGFPLTRVVMLSGAQTAALVAAAMESGIHGYLLKSSSPDELASAIRSVHAGEFVFDGPARDALVEWALRPIKLDDHELEMLRLVAKGADNDDVGSALAMSRSTVKRNLQKLFTKLGAKTRTEAAVTAVKAGII
jgi:DNA-binding NarL/FixJ family response regulator